MEFQTHAQDIRELFNVFDSDGSGELDENEFLEVLGCAGRGVRSGIVLYHFCPPQPQVHLLMTDPTPSVSSIRAVTLGIGAG